MKINFNKLTELIKTVVDHDTQYDGRTTGESIHKAIENDKKRNQ